MSWITKNLKMGQNKDLVCYRKSSQPGGVLDDSGSKSRVLNIKEMLRVFRSQKMSTASDQYFSSYVKKKPAGIGLK